MRWSVSALLVAVLTLGVTVVAASPAQAASPQAGTAAGDAADGAAASPTPVAKVEASATASPAATPAVTPSSDATSEPEAAATPTPSAKPASAEPSASPTAEEEASAGATATPTAREGEPTASADSDSRPTIVSDLADYPPGGTVTLTGTGWQPGEVVTIVVNDTGGLSWSLTEKVVADADGLITLTFELPDYYIPDYDVTATGTVSGTATTTFTDAATGAWQFWLTESNPAPGNVIAGDAITYTLNARSNYSCGLNCYNTVYGAEMTLTLTGNATFADGTASYRWQPASLTRAGSSVTVTVTVNANATASSQIVATIGMYSGSTNGSLWVSSSGGRYASRTHTVVAAAAPLPCVVNTVYTLADSGALYRVTGTTGAATSLGASMESDANGLGVTRGGAALYAVQQADNTSVSVYKYRAATGAASTLGPVALEGAVDGGNLVGGAVSPTNDIYYFGGYNSSAQFVLYGWNTATDTGIGMVARVSIAGATAANGDIAFDSAGSMYLINSVNSGMQILASVPAASVPTTYSNTRTLTATVVTTGTITTNGYNGITFDGSGYLFRQTSASSGASTLYYGNNLATTGSNPVRVGSTNVAGVDLASCSLPGSLTVRKNIVGRVNEADQFTIRLGVGAAVSASATTSGTTIGVQAAQVGPAVGLVNTVYRISEVAGSTGTDLARYASSYECFYADGSLFAGGTGVSRDLPAFPDSGTGANHITCTFTNTPIRTLTVRKTWINGVNGDKADLVINNATTTPGKATSTSNGNLGSWTDTGNVATATPTPGSSVSVAEAMQSANKGTYTPGLACVDGNSAAVSVSSGTFTMPNSNVTCTFTNDGVRPTIALWKTTVGAAGGQFSFALTNTVQAGGTVTTTAADTRTQVDGNTSVAGIQPFTVANFGTAVTIAEPVGSMPAGWTLAGATCKSGTETVGSLTGTTYTIPASALTAGAVITCDFTNRPIVGTVTWSKVDAGSTTTLLAGSEWTLTGPSYPGGMIVADCVAASVAACTGLDKDPAAGAFSVASLAYGSYTLVERIAPVGFQLDTTPRPFAIATDGQSVSLGAITNQRSNVPSLPLTGGTSADAFLFTGAALFAAAGIGGWLHRRRLLRSS